MKYLLPLIGSLVLVWTGCSEEWGSADTSASGNSGNELSLCLNVPVSTKVTVRSASEQDENQLKTVDVLWFTPATDGTGDERFAGRTSAVPDDRVGDATRIARVYLPSGLTSPVHIVVLANLRAELAKAAGGSVADNLSPNFSGLTKDEVLASITYDQPGTWLGGESGAWRALPMWGESKTTVLPTSELTQNQVGTIALMRATARVDIGCAYTGDTPGTLANFELATVDVYNMDDAGRAVPLPANFNAAGGVGGKGIVTAPTLVADAGKVAAADNGYTATNGSLIRKIYLPEASMTQLNDDGNVEPKTDADACCLVVGGYYKGSAELSYYRVDFRLTTGGVKQRVPLLRNHCYRVNITSVRGAGASNADEAFADASVGNIISWEIEARDESSLDNVVFDGRYHLTTSATSLLFYRTGPQRSIDIFTDYPAGWKVLNKPGWIQFEDEAGAVLTELPAGKAGITSSLRINVTGEPGAYAREAFIIVAAGGLQQKITLTQQTGDFLDLTITPEKLYFSKSAPEAQKFNILVPSGVPADAVVTYSFVPSRTMVQSDFKVFPTINGSGEYSIQPNVYNTSTNSARESFVSVTISKGDEIVQKLLTIIQRAYDGLAQVIARQFYATEGSTGNAATPDPAFSADVHSDNAWSIRLNNDYYAANPSVPKPTDSWLTLYNTSVQPPTGAGSVKYYFGMTPNYTYANRVAMMASYDERTGITEADRAKPFRFSLLQKGDPLVLSILAPAPIPPAIVPKIDFGSALAPQPQTLRFKANSRWMWKLKAADVVKSYNAKGAPTTDDANPVALGDGNPWTMAGDEITLHPYTYASEEDLPMSGDFNGELVLRSVLDTRSVAAGVQPIEYHIPVVRSFGSIFTVAITVNGVVQKVNSQLDFYNLTNAVEFGKVHDVRIRVTSNKEYTYYAPDGSEDKQQAGTKEFAYTVPAGQERVIKKHPFRVVCGSRTVTFAINKYGYVIDDIYFKDVRFRNNGWTNAWNKNVEVVVKGVYENLAVNLDGTTLIMNNTTGAEQTYTFPLTTNNSEGPRGNPLTSELLNWKKTWGTLNQQPFPGIFASATGWNEMYYVSLHYAWLNEITKYPEEVCKETDISDRVWGDPGNGYRMYPGKVPYYIVADMKRYAYQAFSPDYPSKYSKILAGVQRRDSYYYFDFGGSSGGPKDMTVINFFWDKEGYAAKKPTNPGDYAIRGFLCVRPILQY